MLATYDSLIACAPRSLQSHVANLQSKSTGQGGGIGRRARLRIRPGYFCDKPNLCVSLVNRGGTWQPTEQTIRREASMNWQR